jgi:hypothetical protein
LLAIEHPTPGTTIVHYRPTARTRGLPHEISTSADALTDWRILCDGVQVDATKETGRASFVCPASDDAEHSFALVGTPNTSM